MKKVIITTIVQSITFVLIYTVLGYYFNEPKTNFIEYLKTETYKNLFFLILMFVVFFIGNYISKDKEITWKDIFKKNKKMNPKLIIAIINAIVSFVIIVPMSFFMNKFINNSEDTFIQFFQDKWLILTVFVLIFTIYNSFLKGRKLK